MEEGGWGEKSKPTSPARCEGRAERVVCVVEVESWVRARAITFVLP